ncbi:MAG: hypothetical protein QOH62_329 [Solirubrobacteraceae bacterium]|nr:hypothetical protein [Solirubrobacteraceae bacterium]
MGHTTDTHGVTRRSLLRTGGTATLVAIVGTRPWSIATAAAAESSPAYLRRSSYLPLVGDTFRVGNGSILLDEVSGDREDVFGLTFSGDPLEQGIHNLRHPQLGTFSLFIAPVGGAVDKQVVVDRSVKLSQATAAAGAPPVVAAPVPTAPAAYAVPAAAQAKGHQPLFRHAKLRRAGHGLRCELTLRRPVKRVELRLLRSGRTLARASKKLHGDHLSLRLATRHRLPAGQYDLLVVTTDLKGRVTAQVTTVGVR